jgi:hypothetical protein
LIDELDELGSLRRGVKGVQRRVKGGMEEGRMEGKEGITRARSCDLEISRGTLGLCLLGIPTFDRLLCKRLGLQAHQANQARSLLAIKLINQARWPQLDWLDCWQVWQPRT